MKVVPEVLIKVGKTKNVKAKNKQTDYFHLPKEFMQSGIKSKSIKSPLFPTQITLIPFMQISQFEACFSL